ncbi:hypothetical protein ACFQPF_01100 [Fictibacillus iocasae]|uniref:Uncharacterized protein n=1 Tax=Fictibacillus iocasae TaxID=2715437 RepID=A0ABW2NLU8_9BACL
MLFLVISILILFGVGLIFKRAGIVRPYSKTLFIAIAIAFLSVLALSQNYTQSLIPEANDGIGISNFLAYWIIGEAKWTHVLFKTFYDQSTYVAFFLVILYPIVLVTETKSKKKMLH